jgi:hypothetical protein
MAPFTLLGISAIFSIFHFLCARRRAEYFRSTHPVALPPLEQKVEKIEDVDI